MNTRQDVFEFNRDSWDQIAQQGDRYYQAATGQQIAAARRGQIPIHLTPVKRVPAEWLGDVQGRRVLGLACGGGQQAPLLAAAGADVIVFDCSPAQLQRDREIAMEYGLSLHTIQGDMADLSLLENDDFDLVINPCSVCFCPDVATIWREVHRVLKPGGSLLAGFINPVNYLFDAVEMEQGKLLVRHSIPYSDLQLDDEERNQLLGSQRPLEFGHSLTQLIGEQIDAGLALTGFYEDRWGNKDLLSDHLDVFVATRSTKPQRPT